MLTIAGVTFEEDKKTRDTVFFFDDEDGEFSISLDIAYLSNTFEGEECSPSLCINWFDIKTSNLSELVGESFCINDMEEADEREDTFCLFENEPFVDYKLTILAVKDKTIHIECTGTAVLDGYEDPYTTAHFELDCWLPIITCPKDWDSLGL